MIKKKKTKKEMKREREGGHRRENRIRTGNESRRQSFNMGKAGVLTYLVHFSLKKFCLTTRKKL